MGKYSGHELKESAIFFIPLVLFLGLFVLLPIIGTIISSLYQDISFLDKKFIFIDNYRHLPGDGEFRHSFRFTILFVAVSVPIEIVLGVIFALILNHRLPLRGFLRAAVLIPWAIPAAISARTWELIYNFHYGLANYIFLKTGLSEEAINWLGTGVGAFIALVMADVWKTTPLVAIIVLAGLQAIPDDLMEQAQIDRANFWQRFFRIALPLLRPVIIVALLFRTIDGLRIFDLIYVLTGGGPGGATTSLSLYGYRYFISGDFGYGAAISMTLFFTALILSIVYIKAARFGEIIR